MGFSRCWKCETQFWIPDDLESAARTAGDIPVFCAYGHRGVFAGKDAKAELEREAARLRQKLAEKDDTIRYERDRVLQKEKQLSATRGVVTRIKNRVGHGVCPCCSRTFENLQRHMKTKHAEYAKSDVILAAAE